MFNVMVCMVSGGLLLCMPTVAQAFCVVNFQSDDLIIGCGSSDDVVEVYVEDVAQNDQLIPTLFVDIGDGPVDQGPADNLSLVNITTGDGRDDVSVHDVQTNLGLEVMTGGGSDVVAVGPDVGAEEVFIIQTGEGKDRLAIGLNVVSAIDIKVRTGSGADTVVTLAATPLGIPGVSALRNIIIDGGGGIGDSITSAPDSLIAGRRVVLTGFGVD